MTPAVLKAARALDRALAKEQALIDGILAKLHPRRRRRSGSRRRFWTEAEDQELRRLYPDTPTAELARRIGRSVCAVYVRAELKGLNKSAAYLASPAACRLRRDPNPGIRFRYAKGHIPANKGLRRPGYAPGRMAETQFKPGQKGSRWAPVGSTRIVDGYQYTKIRDLRSTKGGAGFVPWTRNWKPTHILLWEKPRGAIPPGHALAFRNGDRSDIQLDNLELISREELMRRNSVHRLPPELAEVVQLRGALVRQINRRARA